jgi:large subunit ribosomal protein L1
MADKKDKKVKKEDKVHISGLKGGQRVTAIEAEPIVTEESAKEEAIKKSKGPKVRGKKYIESKSKVNVTTHYTLEEAVKLAKETSYSSFVGSLELHIIVKKAGTNVNVTLPNSVGKEKRIEIVTEETLKKIADGKIDFDVLVATPDMMPKLVPFARILGPKGLMPSAKNGTLTSDPKKYSGSATNIKTEREAPLVHTVIGKTSMEDKLLIENAEAILKALGGARQVIKVYLKATMGPAIKVRI